MPLSTKNNLLNHKINLDILFKFKHIYSGRVQFAEVDSFNIAHNLRFLYWLEAARTDYFIKMFPEVQPSELMDFFPTMSVHSEIDYLNSARIFDIYEVLTRISFIKRTSFGFENLIRIINESDSGNNTTSNDYIYVAKASSILVHIDKNTSQPVPIDYNIKEIIKIFEGKSLKLLK